MASPTLIQRTNRALTSAIALPVSVLRYAAAEPLITGSLLFALTRAPAQYRARLLKLLHDRGVSSDRVALLVRSLKFLLAIGVARRLNQTLTSLALNHWHLRKPGAPFRFGDTVKSELVVITGGCSGFGYEMVKGFSRQARVVILDILPVPEELERSELTILGNSLTLLSFLWPCHDRISLPAGVTIHVLPMHILHLLLLPRWHAITYYIDVLTQPASPRCVLLPSRPYGLLCNRDHGRSDPQGTRQSQRFDQQCRSW